MTSQAAGCQCTYLCQCAPPPGRVGAIEVHRLGTAIQVGGHAHVIQGAEPATHLQRVRPQQDGGGTATHKQVYESPWSPTLISDLLLLSELTVRGTFMFLIQCNSWKRLKQHCDYVCVVS